MLEQLAATEGVFSIYGYGNHDRYLGQAKCVVELVTTEVHNRDPCKCRFLVELGPHSNHFALNRDRFPCIRSLSLKLAIQVLLFEVLP